MHLQRIRDHIEAYKKALPQSPNKHVWVIQATFQKHWDIEASDLGSMFDQSLNSPVNRRLWSRENYQPKAAMAQFIQMEPEQVRLMFRDLFRNELDVQNRINRFIYYADELLDQYRELKRKPILAGHDQNHEAVCLYLALRFPNLYAPYQHKSFIAALQDFSVRELPVIPDPERWFKVARTLHGLLTKDPQLMEIYAQFRTDSGMYQDETFLLSWDFVQFVANENI